MSLLERLEQDYVTAYKAKDQVRLGVLRLLKTAIKNMQVEKMRSPEDADVLIVLQRQAKQRQESIDQYNAAGRPDLADREAAELAVLQAYLPRPYTAEELDEAVSRALESTGVTALSGMGRVVQHVLAGAQGRADGKRVSAAVRTRLQNLR